MEARLPVSVTLSFALHAGGAAAWVALHQVSGRQALRTISNVDLLVTVRRPAATQAPTAARAKAPPTTTWDILKMALPSMPKVAAPLEAKPIDTIKKPLLDVPDKLEADRGRLKKAAALDALDLGRRRTDAAQLDVAQLEAKTRRSSLAEAPKLEDVGVRKVSRKTLELAALAEEERGRLQPQGLDALAAPMPKRERASAPALLPEEAAPAQKRTALSRMADMLTSEAAPLQLEPKQMPMETAPKRMDALKASGLPARPAQQQALGEKKKAMEIEGPLAGRRVLYYELPRFPDWAVAQGITEAELQIRFYVNAAGDVLPEMRVERTSGYGRLDRLAMETLKRWRFEPAGGEGRQWGLITFRFVLE